jgi:hypothetical protein
MIRILRILTTAAVLVAVTLAFHGCIAYRIY